MELKKLIEQQIEMDNRHGFPVTFAKDSEAYTQLSKDLIGLLGEIGEFANIVKKINIKIDRPGEYELDISLARKQLGEELTDSLIYIIRIAAILEIDLENELINTMKNNESRYFQLRKK